MGLFSKIKNDFIKQEEKEDKKLTKIEKEELDLVMLLEELDSALKPLFHERKIATNYNIPYEELYMEADYSRLKQVLLNIFKNAVEAKDGSKEKSIIEVVVKDLGKDVSIKIKDNGIGMTKEELDKVGQMFFTTKKKGTGLGTCLSKEIIKLHDGNITYSSKKNEWTEVNITLPKGEVMS